MILLTGGSGLLGTELRKYIDCVAPSHTELDITKLIKWNSLTKEEPELVIHAAAYTDLIKAEKEKEECFKVNFFGTKNVVDRFYKIPIVYISTEYVYRPVNFYTWTKIEAEKYVRERARKFLIIRTLFKPTPFPHPMAFADQYTRGDYVDVMAPLITAAIVRWTARKSQIENVGTERKTMYELALRTRPDVKPGSVKDIKEVRLPADYE